MLRYEAVSSDNYQISEKFIKQHVRQFEQFWSNTMGKASY